MKSRQARFVFFLLFLVSAPFARAASPSFDAWADVFTTEWVRTDPALATRTQYFSGAEQDAFDRQLTLRDEWGGGFGRKAIGETAVLAQRGLEALKGFPRDTLTPSQRTSAALLEWSFKMVIAEAAFPLHDPVFNQMSGLHLYLVNFLTQTHPIRNQRDAENYLVRLALVGGLLDEGIVEARAAAEAGLLPPRFIVQRTIEQLDGFIKNTPRENVFVAEFDVRLGLLGAAIAAEDRTRLVQAAEKIVAESVIPAYRRVRALQAEQLPRTSDDAGVWRLPRGAERYRQALASNTTTNLGVEEIHAIGLREVARLEAEMDKILRGMAFVEGSLLSRFKAAEASTEPRTDSDPRPAILARTEVWVREAEQRAGSLFEVLPKAPIVVKREPAFSEKTAAAHYADPAPDGSRPGIYWLPLPGSPFADLGARSTAYHEAVPGHHFQLALQQEMQDLPRFRRLGIFGANNAYIEGWALYAERLADEEGWYAGDPQGRLGYLDSMLFRARRLVVDTGLHAKKWTRQQAIDYGIEAREVERYVVWPGQACSYMIGQLRIVELREKARGALGPKFSIQQFHRVVLGAGTVPLDVLGGLVDEWIAVRKTQP